MFTPQGYRTRPVMYERGMSGKQSATRYPESIPEKPIVLLVMDSNGRNIVKPQKINPSKHTSFELAAISIPGGKTFHACTELRHLDRCRYKISNLVLALGTNDVSEGENVLHRFRSRIENLIRVASDVYPEAKISYASILSRHDEFSEIVPEANEIIQKVMLEYGMKYINIEVEQHRNYWSDRIHLSDEGLSIYMQKFEIQVEEKLFNNPGFKPTISTQRRSYASRNTSFPPPRFGLKRQSPHGDVTNSRPAKRTSFSKFAPLNLNFTCEASWPCLGDKTLENDILDKEVKVRKSRPWISDEMKEFIISTCAKAKQKDESSTPTTSTSFDNSSISTSNRFDALNGTVITDKSESTVSNFEDSTFSVGSHDHKTRSLNPDTSSIEDEDIFLDPATSMNFGKSLRKIKLKSNIFSTKYRSPAKLNLTRRNVYRGIKTTRATTAVMGTKFPGTFCGPADLIFEDEEGSGFKGAEHNHGDIKKLTSCVGNNHHHDEERMLILNQNKRCYGNNKSSRLSASESRSHDETMAMSCLNESETCMDISCIEKDYEGVSISHNDVTMNSEANLSDYNDSGFCSGIQEKSSFAQNFIRKNQKDNENMSFCSGNDEIQVKGGSGRKNTIADSSKCVNSQATLSKTRHFESLKPDIRNESKFSFTRKNSSFFTGNDKLKENSTKDSGDVRKTVASHATATDIRHFVPSKSLVDSKVNKFLLNSDENSSTINTSRGSVHSRLGVRKGDDLKSENASVDTQRRQRAKSLKVPLGFVKNILVSHLRSATAPQTKCGK